MPSISQSFRCFEEVTRRGSVRRAAEALHLTAAAVNQQILNLESQVGLPLFDRLPRGMQLTFAGETLIAAVRRCQRDYDNALYRIQDLRELKRGHISIGVSHSSAAALVPELIMAVNEAYPGLTFSVRSGNGENLLNRLVSGEIDLAYCLSRAPPPGVEELRSWSQHLGVALAPHHPLAEGATITLLDCLEYPVVLMEHGMELRSMLDSIDAHAVGLTRPFTETDSVALACKLVESGQAVAFLIPENVIRDIKNGALVWRKLAGAGAESRTSVYQRSGQNTSIAMGVFLKSLYETLDAITSRYS